MIRKVSNIDMGNGDLGWLKSKYHFSFAEYNNPDNIRFGVLRVFNDNMVKSHSGYDVHPHRDMEIFSYVVDGQMSHADNMGNEMTLGRGHIQYMSAGNGIYHSEYNHGRDDLRFIQIWISPNAFGHEPRYGDYRYEWGEREKKWLHMVSNHEGEAPIKVNQDVNIYSLFLEDGDEIKFRVDEDRQAYLVQLEGSSIINSTSMEMRDALEIIEEDILIDAVETSHFIVVEMEKAME